MNNYITPNSDCLVLNKNEYISQLSFASSRIRQDKKIELDMKQEYSGRELYEMIQNADDEASPKVELILTDDQHFHIKNWGDRPFTEGGLLSIMRSHISQKTNMSYQNASVKPIGNKGLGFRSLLNWSDEITIHSNGVRCSFSKDIALREWGKLKTTGKDEGRLTDEDAILFEQERADNLPIPILSIPQVEKDDITKQGNYDENGSCTTDVEVHCTDESIVNDIESKLTSLPSSVLLFLRNVKQIEIDCKGKRRIIRLSKSTPLDKNGLSIYTISDDNDILEFAVHKYLSPDKSYEVGVAYPINSTIKQQYLYSYFPTQVRLEVPAIYHGTFELNSSRNHLIDSSNNRLILEKLGEIAVELSTSLITLGLMEKDKIWDPFNILNFSTYEIESAVLSPLADSVKSKIESAEIFPTVCSGYKSIKEVWRLGEKFALWLLNKGIADNEFCQESFHLSQIDNQAFSPNRFLSGFVLDKIRKNLDEASDCINGISRQNMNIEQRADFIDAIVECGFCRQKLSLLVDAGNEVIEGDIDNPAYVLSMTGNTVLPQCLNIHSVDSDLIDQLKNKWNLEIRRVTERLQQVTSVINGDHTAIRKKIESWSSKEMEYEGMCEVLKWEFHNQSFDSANFSSDLCLINRLNEKKKACELVLYNDIDYSENLLNKIDDKWLLKDSVSGWKETLEADSVNEVANFIYNVVGVSQMVPTDHVYFGNNCHYLDCVRHINNKNQIPNMYCNRFEKKNKDTKKYNYSFVPKEEFVSGFTLTEAIGRILMDKRVLDSIYNNNISLNYNKEKTEKVECSFSTFKLKSYKIFAPLQKSIINSNTFGCDINYSYLEKDLSIDKHMSINPLLVTLGAKASLDSLSLDQLYELLSQEISNVGVQKRYKELREAIRDKNVGDEILKEKREQYLSNVMARFKGKIEWMPVDSVYYWDNDQLPQNILSELPKLEIGNRVGEDSVAKIFGVRLAKNINITFSENIENAKLSADLKKFISDRIKYILAYRIGEEIKDELLIKQTVSSLKNLRNNIHIYFSSNYSVDGKTQQMKEGDILTTTGNGISEIHYHICSGHNDCNHAMTDPMFCENLNEAICMALKVTSSTMANCFRNIITHDLKYVEFITKKDITPETWMLTLKRLGISEFEQKFWGKYSESQDVKIDVNQISEHILDAKDYIHSVYPYIDLPDKYNGIEELSSSELYRLLRSMKVTGCSMIGDNGLKAYYMDYFAAVRNQYVDKYKSSLYKLYSQKISNDKCNALNLVEEYQEKCISFYTPFYESKAEEIKFEIIDEENLDKIIGSLINPFFNTLEVINETAPDTILPAYETILSEYHMSEGSLDQIDALIAKFDGLENLFRERLEKYEKAEATFSKDEGVKNKTIFNIDFAKCHSEFRNTKDEQPNNKQRKPSKGYTSDRAKYNAGKKAELATFEAMKANDLFEDVNGHSTILNKEGGDDNLHYDITYRKRGTEKTDIRFLEVKSMSYNGIIMSFLEYQFAERNAERYDLAIFHDGKISIIESPFSKKSGNAILEVQPESYQITIVWD